MLDPVRKVVVNATPLIALASVGHIVILRHLYNEVVIPPAVYSEVLAGGQYGIGVADIHDADWIKCVALSDSRRADVLVDLDRGEAEVIALAQEIDADLVIIDERLARRYAKRSGLTLTGTLGVLLRAKSQGILPHITPLIHGLQANGIYLSDEIVAQVLKLADETI